MKKLALSVILAIVSATAAFAQTAPEAEGSTTVSIQQHALPTAQDFASAAHKTGAFVGGLFGGTFRTGVALFAGLKDGVMGTASQGSSQQAQATNDSQSFAASQETKEVKRHTPAPVEDRSIYSVSFAN